MWGWRWLTQSSPVNKQRASLRAIIQRQQCYLELKCKHSSVGIRQQSWHWCSQSTGHRQCTAEQRETRPNKERQCNGSCTCSPLTCRHHSTAQDACSHWRQYMLSKLQSTQLTELYAIVVKQGWMSHSTEFRSFRRRCFTQPTASKHCRRVVSHPDRPQSNQAHLTVLQ